MINKFYQQTLRTTPSIRVLAMAALAIAAAAGGSGAAAAQSQSVEAETILQVPAVDYRKEWVQLGTFSLLPPAGGAQEIHVVYTARPNVDAYLKTGRFPDGAVLVKDIFAARTEALTAGTSSYAGDMLSRFVMVKDAAGKLGSGPRFGNGWGWASYDGAETKRTVTTNYKNDCLGCHVPARETDLIYVRGYPLLRVSGAVKDRKAD
jgi:hypothetical protein